MKITPWGTKIQLKIDEPTVGGMIIESMPTSIECAEVIGIGSEVQYEDFAEQIRIGDKILYKSWGVDIVTVEGTRYYFLDLETKALCGIIKKK